MTLVVYPFSWPNSVAGSPNARMTVRCTLLVFSALADATRARGATIPAWTVLTSADAHAAWGRAVVPAQNVIDLLHTAGLTTPSLPGALTAVLQVLNGAADELLTTVKLDAALAQRVLNGDATAAPTLSGKIGRAHV